MLAPFRHFQSMVCILHLVFSAHVMVIHSPDPSFCGLWSLHYLPCFFTMSCWVGATHTAPLLLIMPLHYALQMTIYALYNQDKLTNVWMGRSYIVMTLSINDLLTTLCLHALGGPGSFVDSKIYSEICLRNTLQGKVYICNRRKSVHGIVWS